MFRPLTSGFVVRQLFWLRQSDISEDTREERVLSGSLFSIARHVLLFTSGMKSFHIQEDICPPGKRINPLLFDFVAGKIIVHWQTIGEIPN